MKALFCLLLICFPALLWADGAKLPSNLVNTMPDIPSQQGIIIFGNEQQTLVIQSSIEGEGESFGWVIPLPANPTRIEHVDALTFQLLDAETQPEFESGGRNWLNVSIFTLIFALLICLNLINFYTGKSKRYFRGMIIANVILLFALMISIPSCNNLRSLEPLTSLGIVVEQSASIGNYKVNILKAESPNDLNRWLSENGFRDFPDEADPILEDYIAKGWRFSTAKLYRKVGKGLSQPHPIGFTFPTRQAVYPMRLTKLNAEDLYLQLFVFGQGAASAQYMDRESHLALEKIHVESSVENGPSREILTSKGDYEQLAEIGAKYLLEHTAEETMLTRLTGTFIGHEFDQDILLDFDPAVTSNWRKTYYNEDSAVNFAVAYGLFTVSGLLFVLTLASRKRLKQSQLRRKSLKRVYVPALLGGIACGVGTWLAMPQMENVSVEFGDPEYVQRSRENYLLSIFQQMQFDGVSGQDLRQKVEAEFRKVGEYITAKPKLGHATITEETDRAVAKVYLLDGYVEEFAFPNGPAEAKP